MVWKFVALLIWGSLSIVVIIEEFKILTIIWIEGWNSIQDVSVSVQKHRRMPTFITANRTESEEQLMYSHG